MQPSATDMAHMIYQSSIPNDNKDFTCSYHMLKVVAALDGTRHLAAIAKKCGLPINAVLAAVNRLLAQGLIEPTKDAAVHLNQAFLIYLKEQLSIAVGPIAEIIIEDALKELGLSPASIPVYRAAELVALLAREIQREDERMAFQEKMVERIKKPEIAAMG